MTTSGDSRRGAVRTMARAAGLGKGLGWLAVGAVAASAVSTVARLLGPLAVRSGIDDGIAMANRGMITRAALIFLGLLIVQYFTQRLAQFAVGWVGERYLLGLRSAVFSHLIHLDMGFFDRAKAGVLVSRMTSDIESITEFVNEGAVTFLTNVLTAAGVAVAIAFVDARLALAVFVVIGVLIVLSGIFQHFSGKAYRQVRERIGLVLASLQEGITGVRVVQAFTQEREQAGTFGGVNERYFEANMSAAKAISWYFPSVAFLRVVAIATVLMLGGARVLDGDLTFGSLVVFLLYLDWFFQPIVNLANVYNLLQSAVAALGKVFGLLDTRPRVQEADDARAFPDGLRGEIELSNVTFGYLDDEPVLTNLNLHVPAGQRLAVVGETGAGKSTIAKLAMRFYDPQDGSVSVDGVDLRGVTFASRARSIALIPQDGFLFEGTLRDNIRYARPDAAESEIWSVCEAMGIDGWVRSLPERLDTLVRERGSRFSSGERQLVALARAFLVDPAVIVLDEATSNLDPETELQVEQALSVLLAGRTAVVIAHRLQSAIRADRIVMIDDGRIIADGHHDALARSSDAYRELVSVWERGVLR